MYVDRRSSVCTSNEKLYKYRRKWTPCMNHAYELTTRPAFVRFPSKLLAFIKSISNGTRTTECTKRKCCWFRWSVEINAFKYAKPFPRTGLAHYGVFSCFCSYINKQAQYIENLGILNLIIQKYINTVSIASTNGSKWPMNLYGLSISRDFRIYNKTAE